jgi:hypothetical protein
MSPPTKAGSKGGRTCSSSPSFIPRNVDTAQLCIFIDESKVESLCLGWVRAFKRFCLVDKDFPYFHCGVPTHRKGSNGAKKSSAKVGAY